MFVLAGLFGHAQSTFSLDTSRIFQTIDSREDTPQAAQNEATNANNLITPLNWDKVLDELGSTILRLDTLGGAENSFDYIKQVVSGTLTVSQRITDYTYNIEIDDAGAGNINSFIFHFNQFDYWLNKLNYELLATNRTSCSPNVPA